MPAAQLKVGTLRSISVPKISLTFRRIRQLPVPVWVGTVIQLIATLMGLSFAIILVIAVVVPIALLPVIRGVGRLFLMELPLLDRLWDVCLISGMSLMILAAITIGSILIYPMVLQVRDYYLHRERTRE